MLDPRLTFDSDKAFTAEVHGLPMAVNKKLIQKRGLNGYANGVSETEVLHSWAVLLQIMSSEPVDTTRPTRPAVRAPHGERVRAGPIDACVNLRTCPS